MENEQILSALTKLLEGQKETQKANEKLNLFFEKINAENSPPKIDSTGLERVQQDILKMQKQLSEMPKNIIQQKRFLLFPEYNAKEYYSSVLKWLLYTLIATYIFWLLKFWIEKFLQ